MSPKFFVRRKNLRLAVFIRSGQYNERNFRQAVRKRISGDALNWAGEQSHGGDSAVDFATVAERAGESECLLTSPRKDAWDVRFSISLSLVLGLGAKSNIGIALGGKEHCYLGLEAQSACLE